MKRDWDVIREILTEVEGLSSEKRKIFIYGLEGDCATLDSMTSDHVILLFESGFLSGHRVDLSTCTAIRSPKLTWEGHDLLDTMRSNAVWERIKTLSTEKGIELSFDAVKTLGKVALEWVLRQ